MMLEISKQKVKDYILIFIIAQLAMWYGGLAKLIPRGLVSRWNLLQIASIGVLILLFIARKKNLNFFTLVFLISRLTLLTATILNSNIPDMITIYRMVALVLLVDLFSDRIDDLAAPIMLIFEIMIYYNLFTVLTGQVDIYGAYYGALGYDNDFTRYMLSAYIWALFYGFMKKHYIRSAALILAVNLTVFYVWVGTGIISILIVDILVILAITKKKTISVMKGYLAYITVVVAVVFLKLQNVLSFLIVDILHKDLTFTGRTNVWDKALQYFLKSPILGNGMMGQPLETLYLGGAHCHNAFLEQLFRGGIIYAGLFLMMMVLLHKSTKKYIDNKLVCSLCMALCGIWIVCVTESILEDYIIWLAFALIYNLQHSIKTKDEQFSYPYV